MMGTTVKKTSVDKRVCKDCPASNLGKTKCSAFSEGPGNCANPAAIKGVAHG